MNATEVLIKYQSINSKNITDQEELIVSLFDAIDSSDFELLVKYFDQDIIYQRPGYQDLIGIDKLLHFYQYDRVISSGKHHIEKIVVAEKYGSCWGQFIGLHKNGSQLNEMFADVYSFEHSKIKTRRSYFFRPAI
ncbi:MULTISPECIES: nuclear transport factor 2 family protein [Planktothrix]|uniref:nuclear transport factor 2 family protein n=1 Tax=Planktothrix TaxID=54304 RepID=UPI00041D63C2|nr:MULTISPECIES: nuclear transport factor 2 family protein [Planktothrix]